MYTLMYSVALRQKLATCVSVYQCEREGEEK